MIFFQSIAPTHIQGGKVPPSSLGTWLGVSNGVYHDIYAIGVQECTYFETREGNQTGSLTEEDWFARLEQVLESEEGGGYYRVANVSRWGGHRLVIFARRQFASKISNVEVFPSS